MDEPFLSEAIRLAVESVEAGGGPFGAVIVREGTIIAGHESGDAVPRSHGACGDRGDTRSRAGAGGFSAFGQHSLQQLRAVPNVPGSLLLGQAPGTGVRGDES